MTFLKFSALAACLLPGVSFADPVGRYTVTGTNPGQEGTYSGVVEVTRTGDTYSVRWDVGGVVFDGTGLGASGEYGVSKMGPATENDTAIAIAYVSGNSYGLTFYEKQFDGTWSGIWTYAGSDKIATEIWTPE